MIYSHSRLNTFEQCPFKYKLKYINKVKSEIPDTVETFLGSRVHETLEKLYTDLEHQKKNTVEGLIQYYQSQWKKHWSEDILIVKKQYPMKNYQKMGEQYIKDYYTHYFPFDQNKTIAIEDRIIIDLDESGKYRLQGYIDRLSERENGHYEIHDYKTNSRLPTPGHIKNDRQLALYAIGVKNQYPNVKDVQLIWHFLKFDKEITSKRTESELKKLKNDTINLIKKIEKTKSFTVNPSFLCNWCDFKPICPQWSHLFMLNEKAENEYISDTGLQLVDQYIVLTTKKRQMKLDLYVEIEKLEKAIIAFAEKKNVEVVFGSKNQIHIKKQERYIMPSKGSTMRKELEQELKKHGKWDDVKQLDTNALNKILIEHLWDDTIIDVLKKYVQYSKHKRLFVSTKKS